MSVTSRTELVAALSRGDFSGVLGTCESDWLDFKSQPYDVRIGQLTDRGKWTLASDVACFANGHGGLLVLGYRTEKPETAIVEEASAVSQIPKLLVDADAYAKVIADWVYPAVTGISMTWFPPEHAVDRGVFIIDIPAQPDYEKPFLVRKSVALDGRVVDSWSGRVREGDRCQPIPIERLHAQISAGRMAERGGTIVEPLTDVTARLEDLFAKTRHQLTEQNDVATYAIACLASTSYPLPRFYESEAGARRLLQSPPELRPHGFNLAHLGQVTVDAGAFQVGWSGTAVRAEPDGSVCAVAAATEDFLGWAVNRGRQPGQPLLLNPLAVLEFTVEVVRLTLAIGSLGNLRPADYKWALSATGLAQHRVRLERGRHQQIFTSRAAETASADDWTQIVSGADTDAEIAFNLLERFYALFGYGGDAIPYTNDRRLSIEAIASIDR